MAKIQIEIPETELTAFAVWCAKVNISVSEAITELVRNINKDIDALKRKAIPR